MNFKGTKGEWKVVGVDYPTIESKSEECITNPTIASVSTSFRSREEGLSNAKLIADAGTTINKCGLLPSELLEQRNELLESLKSMLNIFNRNLFEGEVGYNVCEKAKQTINKV